jgi:hypothetical protein
MTTQSDESQATWWLSTRIIRRAGSPEWSGYINFIGLPHLQSIRTIDSWCNPYAESSGNWQLESIEQVWEFIEDDLQQAQFHMSNIIYYLQMP